MVLMIVSGRSSCEYHNNCPLYLTGNILMALPVATIVAIWNFSSACCTPFASVTDASPYISRFIAPSSR